MTLSLGVHRRVVRVGCGGDATDAALRGIVTSVVALVMPDLNEVSGYLDEVMPDLNEVSGYLDEVMPDLNEVSGYLNEVMPGY